jgi:N-acetylglucosamine kinase-like BadF-type ATPase
MGIDGGGSTLRAAVVNEELEIVARVERAKTANPSATGPEVARALVQGVMREALTGLNAEAVRAVGIGIAGASAEHSADWLRDVVLGVLPGVRVAASSDLEIALVGAHGERRGMIIVAGTGSAAYGIGDDGRAVRVGGWGYLFGDEGGGFWIGCQALRSVCHSFDEGALSPLARRVLERLDLPDARALVARFYRQDTTDVRGIAALAELVLESAPVEGEARQIVDSAAAHLGRLTDLLKARLAPFDLPIAMAGGLLEHDNPLSRALCVWLGLKDIPTTKYPPVIGAALLAKLMLEGDDDER